MQFKFLLKRLKKLARADLDAVASGADVPIHTLIKIWNGQTPNPRIKTVESLNAYFRRIDGSDKAAA